MIAQDIVIRPIITEKSMSGVLNKVYTFEVAKSANKIEIAKACEELFKVEVAKVNTVSVRVSSAVRAETTAVTQRAGRKQS